MDSALRSRVLGSTGTFEITNDASGAQGFNASFYYEEDGEPYYLFQDEVVALGDTKYIPYFIPSHFPTITFNLEIDANIDSYSLTQTPPVNGITNHSKVGDRLITFQIGRNIQNYLEVNILTEVAPPVEPTIVYSGIYEGPYPNSVYPDGVNTIVTYSYTSITLNFNLTFPAGTTRVRLTLSDNPYYNTAWLTNLPDFVPTANQTSVSITLNKLYVPGNTFRYLQLILNNNVSSSFNYRVNVYEEI